MLRVALFALLVIGCKCIQPYDENSNKWFESTSDEESLRMPQFSPKDRQLAFTVNLENDKELSFTPTTGGLFKSDRESAELVFISIIFYWDQHPEVHIQLKSLSRPRRWTVVSQLFSTPQTDIDAGRAEVSAVIANSLDERFASKLDEQQGQSKIRNTLFKLDWVELVLLSEPPRRTVEGGYGSQCHYVHAGLPVILDPKVFRTLNKVRCNMEIHKMTGDN